MQGNSQRHWLPVAVLVRPIAVIGYPHSAEPGVLDFLNHLGFAYRWSNRVIPLGQAVAEKEIKKRQLNLVQEAEVTRALGARDSDQQQAAQSGRS